MVLDDPDSPIPERDMSSRRDFVVSPEEMDDLMRVIQAAERLLRAAALASDLDDLGPELSALGAAVEQHRNPVDFGAL